MIVFQSLTQSELAQLLLPLSRESSKRHKIVPDLKREAQRARYRAKQIYHWVYQRGVTDWNQMSDLSKNLRVWLNENVSILRLQERQAQQAQDGTLKTLWNLSDGKTIESVLIPVLKGEEGSVDDEEGEGAPEFREFKNDQIIHQMTRLTACISSQVGCAMACKFCLTGIQGLDRHLKTEEIVTQVFELRLRAPVTNLVFMGMGEPLHNFENVVKACEIILDQDGMNFSKRKVTISTSGLVNEIEKLGKVSDVSLAISLNATTDEQRSEIMPVNRRWNIEALLKACRDYPLGSHRRITFEYVMLKDLNDSLEDAQRLVKLMQGMKCKLNLIPFNEHTGTVYRRPSEETVRKFHKYLLDRGFTAMVRASRGQEILAACGQLRSLLGTARGSDRHRDWKSLGD